VVPALAPAQLERRWQERVVELESVALPCGHFIPEEDPESTVAELQRFFL
jgi:pimeloyl-ACP methyl ester carboxylesterase